MTDDLISNEVLRTPKRSERLRQRAAWMYFVEEMTQSAIADALGVGRVTVVRMLAEAKAGWPSAATADVRRPFTVADLTGPEIRERMSGNLCRCACYPNIVDGIAEAAAG